VVGPAAIGAVEVGAADAAAPQNPGDAGVNVINLFFFVTDAVTKQVGACDINYYGFVMYVSSVS
jgi:hypothetical protein